MNNYKGGYQLVNFNGLDLADVDTSVVKAEEMKKLVANNLKRLVLTGLVIAGSLQNDVVVSRYEIDDVNHYITLKNIYGYDLIINYSTGVLVSATEVIKTLADMSDDELVELCQEDDFTSSASDISDYVSGKLFFDSTNSITMSEEQIDEQKHLILNAIKRGYVVLSNGVMKLITFGANSTSINGVFGGATYSGDGSVLNVENISCEVNLNTKTNRVSYTSL